jgi:hypothetical protein
VRGNTPAMDQIAPGIHHWTAIHPNTRMRSHSAYVEPARALIDPLLPEDGLRAFAEMPRPEVVILTNRHHYRHSERFVQAFGCVVRASAPGMHEFAGSERRVEPFAWGDEVAPGIVAHEVGVLCPDESALHIAHGGGALAVADGVIGIRDGGLGFFPDHLLGEDPETVRRGLRESYGRLVELLDFDTLLLAHGEPLAGGGKDALRAFAAAGMA